MCCGRVEHANLQNKFSLGSFNEPLGEFLIAEKRELELEKQFDSTFHSNRDAEDTVTQKSKTRQDGEAPKDRKTNFDEVVLCLRLLISEIFTLGKINNYTNK